jgi:pimeloyl-ACP methyl ester carboxylesterase
VDTKRCAKQLGLFLFIVQLSVFSLLLLEAGPVRGQIQPVVAASLRRSPPTLVIGFMGGFVHSDNLRHSEAQLAQRLGNDYGDRINVEMFENRQRAEAYKLVVDWITRTKAGRLAGFPTEQPRIILFGHSWGASAVVYLARELERDGIRVALTVQVDSIRKHHADDSVIPANVAEAINFYQPNGILHGQQRIKAADPVRTEILGNYRLAYRQEPAACHAYPWYNRLLFKGHTSIECDPELWSQIETLIVSRSSLPAAPEQIQVAEQFTK